MQQFQQRQAIINLLTTALECSFYISPKDPGLTFDELIAFGRVFDLQEGEIGDVLGQVTTAYVGRRKLLPDKNKVLTWIAPHIVVTPEYINVAAFDFWTSALNESAKANGAARARVDRDTTIRRAEATGIRMHDMEVALAITVFLEHVVDKDGVIAFAPARAAWPSISEQRKSHGISATHNNNREKAYLAVKDTIERRTDGRALHAEPLDAFGERLESLGYRHFKLWWSQLVSQLRQSDPETVPVAVLVLAAALAEGALMFVAQRGHDLNVGVFGSSTFEKDKPHKWKIDDLINGAAAGGTNAILGNSDRHRADSLAKARQRIHAGRMLLEFPQGIPDLRPEEAREAKAVADLVVRRILDWLEKTSPTT